MKRTIWTVAKKYSFMTMGGDLSATYAILTEVEPIEVRKVKGIDFFLFKTPKGNHRLAESISGGIIAENFEDMLSAIKGCPKSFLIEQIELGKSLLTEPKMLSNEDFFKLYKY